jgi:hypothetical protein
MYWNDVYKKIQIRDLQKQEIEEKTKKEEYISKTIDISWSLRNPR